MLGHFVLCSHGKLRLLGTIENIKNYKTKFFSFSPYIQGHLYKLGLAFFALADI